MELVANGHGWFYVEVDELFIIFYINCYFKIKKNCFNLRLILDICYTSHVHGINIIYIVLVYFKNISKILNIVKFYNI